MKRLVLVDGNALLHRAYHATPPLMTSKGELVNAVYGFSLMLLKSLQELQPDFIALTWDEKGPTFRHQAYTQYKATRGPADDGLSMQYTRVYEVTKALNIPEFRLAGFEADDLIGTLARQALEQEKYLEVIILTGDRDIMQIISERVRVLMPRKTMQDVGMYGVTEFRERFGFDPYLMIDYKALAGDASDNIPGVPGIGDVTATKLIKQFGTVEEIYKPKNLKLLPDRTQLLLSQGVESAILSKQLATIDCNAPIKLNLSACRVHDYNKQEAINLFEELEFKTLIQRLPGVTVDKMENGTDDVDLKGTIKNRPPQEDINNSANRNLFTTDLDLSVTPVLEKMSQTGVLLDLECLDKLGNTLKARLSYLEKEIYSKVDHEFNLNSPKQLAEVLFDKLKLPVIKKTKTGRSTDEGTLQELVNSHPIIPFILEYRQLFKLISTYIDVLPKFVKEDGRVHSTFNVEGAATGRLSSHDPNLQNIPIKGESGVEIRKAFIAPKNKVLLAADYSQIELRIMAHLADDPGLKEAFKNGSDIHATTASKIFKKSILEINKEQRMVGKTMNFATLYGQGPRALSKQLGISVSEAKLYIEEYFKQFPKVKEWMQKTLDRAYQDGFVETIWGRRRYIPELQASNKAIQSFGERAAINHPIQGTSADMIKKAMVEIDKKLSQIQENVKSKEKHLTSDEVCCQLILQVHDELLFECNPKSLDEMTKMIKEEMERALVLDVPVTADLKIGPNWGEMTKIEAI